MEKALEIANRLGVESFKASNGWLTRWKQRHNIKQRTVSGESGDVSSETVESWLERVPSVIEGYEARNIWNTDETGCFWRALPDKGLGTAKQECKGGKKSKHRITVTFFVNALGESESPPVVIWKSENPRCFKGVKKSCLPTWYYNQKKSWMTGEIMGDILGKLSRKLVREGRSVLLFMDNAGCHPPEITEGYSNIKVMFLPANTTSKLQPLDLGIIKTFKTYYRKLFIRYVLTKIDTCSTATEVVKSITILQAIRWVAEAWKSVDTITIKKCFRKAGILDKDFHVVQQRVLEEDPFRDLHPQLQDEEVDSDLLDLMARVQDDHCSLDTYLCEDDLPTCFDMDNPYWEDDFFADLEETPEQGTNDDSDVEDGDIDELSPLPLKIRSYREALGALEDVRAFFESKGHTSEATQVMAFADNITDLSCQCNSRQLLLSECFNNY